MMNPSAVNSHIKPTACSLSSSPFTLHLNDQVSLLQEKNSTRQETKREVLAYLCHFPSGDLTSLGPLTPTCTTDVLDRPLNQLGEGQRVPTRTLLTKATREACYAP